MLLLCLVRHSVWSSGRDQWGHAYLIFYNSSMKLITCLCFLRTSIIDWLCDYEHQTHYKNWKMLLATRKLKCYNNTATRKCYFKLQENWNVTTTQLQENAILSYKKTETLQQHSYKNWNVTTNVTPSSTDCFKLLTEYYVVECITHSSSWLARCTSPTMGALRASMMVAHV